MTKGDHVHAKQLRKLRAEIFKGLNGSISKRTVKDIIRDKMLTENERNSTSQRDEQQNASDAEEAY